jgi:hypothetical protein
LPLQCGTAHIAERAEETEANWGRHHRFGDLMHASAASKMLRETGTPPWDKP